MLQLSLPTPDSDIGMVAPIVCSIFTPIPMVIAITAYEIKKRCFKKKEVATGEKLKGLDGGEKSEKLGVEGLSYQPVSEKGSDSETETCKKHEKKGI